MKQGKIITDLVHKFNAMKTRAERAELLRDQWYEECLRLRKGADKLRKERDSAADDAERDLIRRLAVALLRGLEDIPAPPKSSPHWLSITTNPCEGD